MRVLIINKFLYPNGGSETYIFKLGEALEQHGHEVQYFGMEHGGRCVGNRVNAYTSGMDFHGGSKLSKLTYPIKTIYSKEARVQLRKVLDDFKPEVCHLNNFNYQLTPSIILEIVKWRKETGRDCKIIFTAHDYQLVCPNHMLKKYPDYRIICLDKLTYAGNLSTLAPVMDNPNFRFVKADICDREAVNKLFEEEHPDIVVNFAAESHVDRSIEDPGIFLQTNIIGTSVLMDACRKYGIQRYHQVSTDEVYGDLPLDRPDLFFTEETPIHTSSPYSSSKAAADLLVLAYHRTYGLPVTISRCSNNYGPYHFPEKLIPLMIANALADKPLPVYGEGLNVRDWLYVEDHCKAIDLIIHKGRVGEVYNVGGHNEKQNIEIVKIICKELGKPESLITHVGDRKGHDMRYAIDPTKIHNELGWLPETKFEDGIKKTIQWYLDNREWWETIISGEYQNYYEKMYSNR